MPNRIHLLPDNLANQIAAGEVIERPASVLKELVENALDAGATRIDIEARGGGRHLLRVTDNGHGMSRDDALLCLERHATSKLRDSAGLARIASFGFRGEAIPSIASVSKFRLRTREAAALAGTEIRVDGGKMLGVSDTGMAPGTEIETRALFFNLPARRKFLKAEATEVAHLKHQLILSGLARPDVGFSARIEGSAPVQWPPAQKLGARIGTIFGSDFFKTLQPVDAEERDLRLRGYIGQPGIGRAGRQEQYVFVNGRPVVNRTLQYALRDGYHSTLARGKHPVAVLFLEIDPANVDVNVHPAKREVRFHNDARLKGFITAMIESALRLPGGGPMDIRTDKAPLTPADNSPANELTRPAPAEASANLPETPSEEALTHPETTSPAPILRLRKEWSAPVADQQTLSIDTEQETASEALPAEPVGPPSLRLLGSVSEVFLAAESPEGLVLVDLRAARERILFEDTMRRLAQDESLAQRLLLPVTLDLPPREADFLRQQLGALERVGFGVSQFGEHTFLIDAVPPMCSARDVAEFMRDLAAELQATAAEGRRHARLEQEAVVRTICHEVAHHAVMPGPDEWEVLLERLLACELPYTCPAGRPTMVQLSRHELNRKFGRGA